MEVKKCRICEKLVTEKNSLGYSKIGYCGVGHAITDLWIRVRALERKNRPKKKAESKGYTKVKKGIERFKNAGYGRLYNHSKCK